MKIIFILCSIIILIGIQHLAGGIILFLRKRKEKKLKNDELLKKSYQNKYKVKNFDMKEDGFINLKDNSCDKPKETDSDSINQTKNMEDSSFSSTNSNNADNPVADERISQSLQEAELERDIHSPPVVDPFRNNYFFSSNPVQNQAVIPKNSSQIIPETTFNDTQHSTDSKSEEYLIFRFLKNLRKLFEWKK